MWPLDGRDAEANGAQSNGCGAPQQMAPNGVEPTHPARWWEGAFTPKGPKPQMRPEGRGPPTIVPFARLHPAHASIPAANSLPRRIHEAQRVGRKPVAGRAPTWNGHPALRPDSSMPVPGLPSSASWAGSGCTPEPPTNGERRAASQDPSLAAPGRGLASALRPPRRVRVGERKPGSSRRMARGRHPHSPRQHRIQPR